jgi:hypothetical protein
MVPGDKVEVINIATYKLKVQNGTIEIFSFVVKCRTQPTIAGNS